MKHATDQAYLTSQQYKDASNLQARIYIHEHFGTGSQDWFHWILDRLQVPANARVLELGTGSATFWQRNEARIPAGWQVTLSDLSEGMLNEARQATQNRFDYRQLDAQQIPFDDATFDGVMANHMLYHVPDIPKALAEVRRVLKPGGRFYAATNGELHMKELEDLAETLVHRYLPGQPFERMKSLSFRLETGEALLREHFETVSLHRFDNALLIDDAEAIVNYYLSTHRFQSLVTDSQRNELRQVILKDTQSVLAKGPLRVQRATGLFEAY
jgi:ubiquinone/menaquinone biosynthesis C-methylase UbiE